MTPMMHTTHYVGGQEVQPGVRIAFPSNHEHITFKITAVCDSTDPDRWHGEVALADVVIIRTGSTDSYDRAGRDAEATLKRRLVRAFSDDEEPHSNDD